MVTIHSDYVFHALWVLLDTPDSSTSLPGHSMKVLPFPLLLINCLSCTPLGGSGPPPFPPPGLTPFPSRFRHLPASSLDTRTMTLEIYRLMILRYNTYTVQSSAGIGQPGKLNSINLRYDSALYNHSTVKVPRRTLIS